MDGCVKPIGGDFWFDVNLFRNDINNNINNNKNLVYLDGGQSAIKFIIDAIKIKSDEYILLPSYLCTNIIDIFVKSNVNIIFYYIKSNLEIDIDFFYFNK